jgi:hypothetical protein
MRIRLGDLDDSSINANPASFPATMPACFLLGAVALHSSRMRIRLRDLGDSSINANPASFPATTPSRFLLGAKALTASLSALLFRLNVKDLVVRAAPTAAFCFTSGSRFGFGSVPMTASLVAIRPGHRDDIQAGGCVNAAPTHVATISVRFFSGTVASTTLRLAIRRGHMNNAHLADFSIVDAAPTITFLAISARFGFRRVALTTPFLAIRLCGLDDDLLTVWSNNAAPTLLVTSRARFGFGSVPMTAALVAIRPGHRNGVHAGGCIDAAPTHIATISVRIVFGSEALTFPLPATLRSGLDHDLLTVWSNNAAPTRLTIFLILSRLLF